MRLHLLILVTIISVLLVACDSNGGGETACVPQTNLQSLIVGTDTTTSSPGGNVIDIGGQIDMIVLILADEGNISVARDAILEANCITDDSISLENGTPLYIPVNENISNYDFNLGAG